MNQLGTTQKPHNTIQLDSTQLNMIWYDTTKQALPLFLLNELNIVVIQEGSASLSWPTWTRYPWWQRCCTHSLPYRGLVSDMKNNVVALFKTFWFGCNLNCSYSHWLEEETMHFLHLGNISTVLTCNHCSLMRNQRPFYLHITRESTINPFLITLHNR